MTKRYSSRIGDFCRANDIEIPLGFDRHPASRYAIILTDEERFKLVARTWFKMDDAVYYIQKIEAEGESPDEVASRMRILDFKEGVELHYTGGKRLKRGNPFQ